VGTLEPDNGARELAVRLNETADKLGALLEQTLRDGDVTPERARVVLSELATGLEELRVAEEELVVQSAQIAESYALIDAERERYGTLFEFAPDGYLETDTYGKVLEANTAAATLLGVPARFLHGKVVHSFVEPDDRRRLRVALASLTERGTGEETVTVSMVGRDSPALIAEIRIAVHNEPSGVPRLRWLVRDITDRVKLEQEIGELHASVDLLTALANVSRLVSEGDDRIDALLQRLVDLAHESTGSDAAIVLVDAKGRAEGRATAGPSAAELCELQSGSDSPAGKAQRDGTAIVMTVDDLGGWPELQATARRYGVSGVAAYPIPVGDRVAGTFNLFSYRPVEEMRQAGELLVQNVAAAIFNAEVYRESRQLVGHLSTALESRGIIDQAKGILMATQRCSADEAFDLLRRASQRENRKLRDIALEIVERATHRPS
jgi:PAS domain S-box-containing protein